MTTIKIDAGVLERELCGDKVNGGFIRTLCFTVWQLCHNPTHEDGNCDWFNDTLPTVNAGVEKIRTLLETAQPQPEVTDAESLYSITKKQRSALVLALEKIDCDCSRFQCYRCDALAIVRSTIPHQPDEVTDAGRKAALNDFDGAVGTATTDYASRDITHEMYPLDAVTVETIRAALSAPAVQEVTEDRFSETVGAEILSDEWPSLSQKEQHDLIFMQLGEFFPNGLHIVRGEGEKS